MGHDYIHSLSETVNPANGSVSIRIAAPMPHERGLNFPVYAFIYDTNGQYQPVPSFAYNNNTNMNELDSVSLGGGALSTGGSSLLGGSYPEDPGTVDFQVQTLTFTAVDQGTITCQYDTDFVYIDPSGGRHSLGLLYIPPDYVTPCSDFNLGSNLYSGGDEQYHAQLTTPNGRVLVVIEDNHGNQMNPDLQIEDTNGNYPNGTGRPYSQSYGNPYILEEPTSISIPGLGGNYSYFYPSTSSYYQTSGSVNAVNVSSSGYCTPTFNSGFRSTNSNEVVTLPNGQTYTLSFDPAYGLVSKIVYPTGAWVTYTWGLNPQAEAVVFAAADPSSHCAYRYDWPAVQQRIVSFDGVHPALEQDFSYSTTWSGTPWIWTSKTTTVTTKDLVRPQTPTFQTIYTYLPSTSYSQPFSADNQVETGAIPVENTITYKDTSGNTLRTVTKVWNSPFQLAAECDVLDNGQTNGVFYQYAPNTLVVTDKAEYDFGQISTICQKPGSTPARETVTQYQSFAATPMGTAIQDRPSSVKLYDHGTLLSETDYGYDETSVAPVSPTAIAHDEANYGATGSAARGNITSITRQCFQNCTSGTVRYRYGYDETGQLVSMTDADNNPPTQYTYTDSYSSGFGSPSGNTNTYVTQIVGPTVNGAAHVDKYSYGFTNGKMTSHVDENNNTTTYCFDVSGCTGAPDPWARLTEINFPDTGQTTISYNDAGPNPSTTISELINSQTTKTTTTIMDAMGHPIETQLTSDPQGTDYTDTTYDGEGNIYTVSNPYRTTGDPTYGITTYTYDSLSRKKMQTQPDGSALQWSYTGGATEVTDEGNGTKSVQRILQTDGLGRLTSVCEVSSVTLAGTTPNPAACGQDIAGTGFLTTYQYDAMDGLLQVSQGGLNLRTFAYDSLARLTSAINPESGAIAYTYDPNGNVHTKTAPAPNQTGSATVTTTYQYDALNRLTQKSYSDGVTLPAQFGYDQSSITMGSQHFNISNSIGRMSWTCVLRQSAPYCPSMTASSYDSMGRTAELWQANPSSNNNIWVSYVYDLAGDETLRSLNGNLYGSAYDAAGRLTTFTNTNYNDATNPPNLLTNGTYNAFGDLISATFANGLSESWAYDKRGRLQAAAVGTACANGSCTGSTVYSFSLGFAPNDNIISANDSVNGNWTYSYDDFNRLAGSNQNGGQTAYSYVYDRFGNRWQQNLTAGSGYTSNLSFTGNNNQMSGYLYDAAGNLLYDGFHSYNYDPEGRIISVDNGSVAYTYDALGRRVGKTVGGVLTNSIIDREGNVILYSPATPTMIEMNAAGLHLGTYVLNSAHTDTVFYYDHGDWLGTERARIDLSGNACETITSVVFGDGQTVNGTCGDISPRHFTGKERDSESGLDYFGARYMSSSMGRFMSPDPSGLLAQHPEDPQSWNLYAYARNNPLTMLDPDGLDCIYANDAGNGVESIDHNSNSGECGQNGGSWAPGYVNESWAHFNFNTDLFQVGSINGTGSSATVDYTMFAAGATTQFNGDETACTSGCAGFSLANADWLSSQLVGNSIPGGLNGYIQFLTGREQPLGGGALNALVSGPLDPSTDHWAGPGGMGPPGGQGDWAASVHDYNFSMNGSTPGQGITIGNYFNPTLKPAVSKALIQSNNQLIRHAGGVQGVKMGLFFGAVNAFQWYANSWK